MDISRRNFAKYLPFGGLATAGIGGAYVARKTKSFENLKDEIQNIADVFRQTMDTRPSGFASTETSGFVKLADQHPWVQKTRGSVGLLEYFEPDGQNTGSGSVVLLDSQTIALCAHEVIFDDKFSLRGKRHTLSFAPKNGSRVFAELKDFVYEPATDIAFATIKDASFVAHSGLSPVVWAASPALDTPAFVSEIISVGWPNGTRLLHATRSMTGLFTDRLPVVGGTMDCKVLSYGVTFAGMSGGGVFSNGIFGGIINSGTSPGRNASSSFTSASLIRGAYTELYPERAQQIGVAPSIRPDSPACVIDRHRFLSIQP